MNNKKAMRLDLKRTLDTLSPLIVFVLLAYLLDWFKEPIFYTIPGILIWVGAAIALVFLKSLLGTGKQE
jgi:hypothetical protein